MRIRPLVLAVASLFVLACSGLTQKGPWHGEVAFTATLIGTAPTAAADAGVFVQRLQSQGVEVVATELSDTELRLEISEARSTEVLLWVLPAYRLEVRNAHGTLHNDEVASASARLSEHTAEPVVDVVLTEPGKQAFCAMSKAGLEQNIDIEVDGKVLSSPVVMEAICGGRLQISMGQGSAEEAEALAMSLASPPLASTWVIKSLDEGGAR